MVITMYDDAHCENEQETYKYDLVDELKCHSKECTSVSVVKEQHVHNDYVSYSVRVNGLISDAKDDEGMESVYLTEYDH